MNNLLPKKGRYVLIKEDNPKPPEEGREEEGTPNQPEPMNEAAADAPAPAPAPEGPIVKILNTNGQTFQIPIHLPNESVESLKQKISATCSVPPPQQRLIYKGRMLQDGQTLQACGIEDKVVVHLFARPPRAVPQGGDSSSDPTGAGLGDATSHFTININNGPSIDGDLTRASNSVKLFSSCLVAICTMQMLLLMLELLGSWQTESTGGGTTTPGDDDPTKQSGRVDTRGPTLDDDSATFFLQVLLNSLGIYIGIIGVRSAHTLDLRLAKAYFYGLLLVGALWITVRIIWAVKTLEYGYDADIGHATNEEGKPEDVPKSELLYIVCVSISVYISIWSVCFIRASQFYRAVSRLGLGAAGSAT